MTRLRNVPPRLATVSTRIAAAPAKQADDHYLTPEHRAWRAIVIANARGLCQGHDHTGPRRGGLLYADHIHELRDGGAPLDPANGQALCASCHARKTAAARAQRMATPT